MNHLTALFAALAAVFVAMTSYELLIVTAAVANHRRKLALAFTPSAITALLFAFSPLVWEHSVGAEVFALNNLLCAMVVFLTVKVIIGVFTITSLPPVPPAPATSSSKHHKATPAQDSNNVTARTPPGAPGVTVFVLLGAFTCGLALSNQHASLLLLVVAVPAVLVATSTQKLDLSLLFQLAVMFVLGLVSYNYLFVASLHPKPGSWGELANVHGLLGHVLRTEYGTFSLGMTLGSEGFLERIWIYILHLVDDRSFHVLLPLAVLGFCSVLYDHDVHKSFLTSNTKKKRVLTAGGGKTPVQGKNNKQKGKKTQHNQKVSATSSLSTPVKSKVSEVKGGDSVGQKNKTSGRDKKPSREVVVETKETSGGAKRGTSSGMSVSRPGTSTAAVLETSPVHNTTAISSPNTTPTTVSVLPSTVEIAAPVSSCTAHPDGQFWSVVFLAASWLFYLLVWNGVLSNIPLSAPMPYGVHARFWMQPNIVVFIFVGLGFSCLLRFMFQLLSPEEKTSKKQKTVADISTSVFDLILQCSVVSIVFVLLMQSRFDSMDRSQDGWMMHEYGNFILQSTSAHSNSLLLSHTDLNWNTVRYLQVCEGVKSEDSSSALQVNLLDSEGVAVSPQTPSEETPADAPHATHLNFQLMPFPWFPKQQAPLYPDVTFPPMFQGVSTQRMTTENAYLVDRFLSANIQFVNNLKEQKKLKTIWGDKRPIFLDMQAINDLHIDPAGTWRNFTLIPWGLVYLVHERRSVAEVGAFHSQSLRVLKILRRKFLPLIHEKDLKINRNYNLTTFFEEQTSPQPLPEAERSYSFLSPRANIPFMAKYPPGS
jgi:hypothetical protein